jgi:predicted site-specific integrase-resolvase
MENLNDSTAQFREEHRTNAKLSNFMSSIDDLKPRRVVIYARDSDRSQKDHLPHQIAKVKAEVEKRGSEVTYISEEIEPGHFRTL